MTIKISGGAVFLHIPKTGGSWVERVLTELGLVIEKSGHEHADFDRILYSDRLLPAKSLCLRLIRKKLSEMVGQAQDMPTPKFCFVRNPFSWYESWWRYMKGCGWNDWGKVNSGVYWHPNAALNGLGSDDFNTFVMNVVRSRPGYVTELYYSYAKAGVDYIGKTENLAHDLADILKLLGIDFDEHFLLEYGRVNVSPKQDEQIIWDDDVRDIVRKVELPGLIHFGYIEETDLKVAPLLSELPANPAVLQNSIIKHSS